MYRQITPLFVETSNCVQFATKTLRDMNDVTSFIYKNSFNLSKQLHSFTMVNISTLPPKLFLCPPTEAKERTWFQITPKVDPVCLQQFTVKTEMKSPVTVL